MNYELRGRIAKIIQSQRKQLVSVSAEQLASVTTADQIIAIVLDAEEAGCCLVCAEAVTQSRSYVCDACVTTVGFPSLQEKVDVAEVPVPTERVGVVPHRSEERPLWPLQSKHACGKEIIPGYDCLKWADHDGNCGSLMLPQKFVKR